MIFTFNHWNAWNASLVIKNIMIKAQNIFDVIEPGQSNHYTKTICLAVNLPIFQYIQSLAGPKGQLMIEYIKILVD